MQKRTEQDPVPRIFFILQTRFRICFGKHLYEYMLRKTSLRVYASESIPTSICFGKYPCRNMLQKTSLRAYAPEKHPCEHLLRKISLQKHASENIPAGIASGNAAPRTYVPGTYPCRHSCSRCKQVLPARFCPKEPSLTNTFSVRKNRP